MTPMFSTVLNFSIKAILQRVHKLNYLSTVESSENIMFPRVRKRLLQINQEGENTLSCTGLDIVSVVERAKDFAVALSHSCGMLLDSYDDDDLVPCSFAHEDDTQHESENEEENPHQGTEPAHLTRSEIIAVTRTFPI